jgi:hypothetical protein
VVFLAAFLERGDRFWSLKIVKGRKRSKVAAGDALDAGSGLYKHLREVHIVPMRLLLLLLFFFVSLSLSLSLFQRTFGCGGPSLRLWSIEHVAWSPAACFLFYNEKEMREVRNFGGVSFLSSVFVWFS